MKQSDAKCHVCGASAEFLGSYQPYTDIEVNVYDCAGCGSLISPHSPDAHLVLHSGSSSYDWHYQLATECREAFRVGNLRALEDSLRSTKKFQYIIDSIKQQVPSGGRVLEIGCSTGSLGAWPILAGYDYLGLDVSPTAVDAARDHFGQRHFALADDVELQELEKFDVIYHVGTIGCIAEPFNMTRQLLRLLKPGGVLLFNAPNREACIRKKQLWVEGTHPPDLVSLFTPDVWESQFQSVARTQVQVDYLKGWHAIRQLVSALVTGPWHWEPRKKLVVGDRPANSVVRHQRGTAPGRLLHRGVKVAWRHTVGRLSNLICKDVVPAEFGIYVQMSPTSKTDSASAA
ncbi:MAG: class I SAM-dependent methyltransferase [Fuerstiella sp.]